MVSEVNTKTGALNPITEIRNRTLNNSVAQNENKPVTVTQPDRVDLTEAATKLHALEKSLSQEPAFDAQKVEAIRKAIEDGNYSINPDKIANKLLDIERSLSTVGKS